MIIDASNTTILPRLACGNVVVRRSLIHMLDVVIKRVCLLSTAVSILLVIYAFFTSCSFGVLAEAEVLSRSYVEPHSYHITRRSNRRMSTEPHYFSGGWLTTYRYEFRGQVYEGSFLGLIDSNTVAIRHSRISPEVSRFESECAAERTDWKLVFVALNLTSVSILGVRRVSAAFAARKSRRRLASRKDGVKTTSN